MILWFGAAAAALLLSQHEAIAEKVEEVSDVWTQYDDLFKKYGAKYSVPWTWLKAIALNESDLGQHPSVAEGIRNPSNIEGSKSSDGKSWGLMQVTVTTARDMDPSASPEKLNDPEYSIDLAARYLKSLEKYFTQSDARRTEWIIKSYNQGPGNSLKEKSQQISGYAQQYWERWQRNLARVEA